MKNCETCKYLQTMHSDLVVYDVCLLSNTKIATIPSRSFEDRLINCVCDFYEPIKYNAKTTI